MNQKRNKVSIQKETKSKHTIISHTHKQRKHMATNMEQHRTIHKSEITSGNEKCTS
jgi:hypothetical protein